MHLEKVVPENRSIDNMPDRIWATYCAMVWCNNSLNSYQGKYLHLVGDKLNESKENHRYDPAMITLGEADTTWKLFERAQEVILALLYETGRIEEFDAWEKEHHNN